MKERLVETFAFFPSFLETGTNLNIDTVPEKLGVTAALFTAEMFTALLVSRSLEGTVYRGHEKVLAVAGFFGVTAVNVLVNYNIWS